MQGGRAKRRGGMAGHSVWLWTVLHCNVLHLHFNSYATILICTCSRLTGRYWWAKHRLEILINLYSKCIPRCFSDAILVPSCSELGEIYDILSTHMKTKYYQVLQGRTVWMCSSCSHQIVTTDSGSAQAFSQLHIV